MSLRTIHPERIAAAMYFRMHDAPDPETRIRLRERCERLFEIRDRLRIHDAVADLRALGLEVNPASVMARLGGKPNPIRVEDIIADPEVPAEIVAFLAECEVIVRRGSMLPIGDSGMVHWVPDFGGEAA